MTPKVYRNAPVWFKATHALLVCLVVLAALRSLVPGLCATLSASADAAKARGDVPSCCAARLAEEDALPAYRAAQDAKEHPACAFCHLVLGLGNSAPAPVATLVQEVPDAQPAAEPAAPVSLHLARANASRAPPAIA